MRNWFLIILGALLISGIPLSGQNISFSQEIQYCFFNLDTLKGNKLLAQHYSSNDPEYIRLISYRDFIRNLLYQSRSGFELFSNQSAIRIKRLEKLQSPGNTAMVSIAEIYLYQAILAWQFSDFKLAFTDLVSSYKIVAKWGSDFKAGDRNKLSGILGVLFQLVPEQYEKYLRVVGVRPKALSGYNGLDRYYTASSPGTIERQEGYLLLITAYKEFRLDPSTAWNFVKMEGKPMLDSPLIRYQSALAALKAGDCESAVKLLDYHTSESGRPVFPLWTYQLGRCKLYQNDTMAGGYLESFLKNPGGDNYRHSALLMSGWNCLMHGNQAQAKVFFLRSKNLPTPFTMYDKQALNEAGSDKMPDVELLKVRLQFDGGYYEKCLDNCDKLLVTNRFHGQEKGELLYRKGRCEQRLLRTEPAIRSFLGVIERADSIKSYLVPNSALQLGYLYKKAGQVDLARKYFQLSLDLNKYGYREGINRQAQSALDELSN
jgi:tetratricopeptide (TPR) repeat protein